MSDKKYYQLGTQATQNVQLDFALTAQGATGPTAVAGTDNWVTATRGASGVAGFTGVTGTYILQTADPYVGFIGASVNFQFATKQAGAWTCEFSNPVQLLTGPNAGQWQVGFTTYQSGVATDMPAASKMLVKLTMRNGTLP